MRSPWANPTDRVFCCENPERDWINDLREAERVRDLPDERQDWTEGELWEEGDDDED